MGLLREFIVSASREKAQGHEGDWHYFEQSYELHK
jgi:hypothetical protein